MFLLLSLLVTDKQLGFVYKLMEKQMLPAINPYVQNLVTQTKSIREKVCDTVLLGTTDVHQWTVRLLVSQISSQHLPNLETRFQKAEELIQSELEKREINSRKEQTSETPRGEMEYETRGNKKTE